MENNTPNIGAIIPVRMASERLPKKALLNLIDQPLIYHLLDRVFASKYITDKKQIVVCTTKEKTDDELVTTIENYGASIFRGETNDILKRFYDAINQYDFDYVIQIDGDDITSEPTYMDLTMDKLLGSKDIDVVSVQGLPLGVATKSFSRQAIQKVIDVYTSKENDTGFASYLTNDNICNNAIINPISDLDKCQDLRLTLDYQEDFDLFEAIFKELYVPGKVFHIADIVNLVKKNPCLIKINSELNEEYWKRWHAKQTFFYSEEGEIKKL